MFCAASALPGCCFILYGSTGDARLDRNNNFDMAVRATCVRTANWRMVMENRKSEFDNLSTRMRQVVLACNYSPIHGECATQTEAWKEFVAALGEYCLGDPRVGVARKRFHNRLILDGINRNDD